MRLFFLILSSFPFFLFNNHRKFDQPCIIKIKEQAIETDFEDLNPTGNCAKYYIARDRVSLISAGLDYTFQPESQGAIVVAQIDETMVFNTDETPSGGVNHHQNSNIRGSVFNFSGVGGISNGGSTTYDLPIMVPNGINAIQPILNIVYNSHSGQGLFGEAWNLSGISSIARTGQIYEHTGIKKTGVQFNGEDRFMLDGVRLISSSERVTPFDYTYDTNDKDFYTENNDFSKITAHGINQFGPEWFTVEHKDGTVVTYGNPNTEPQYANSCLYMNGTGNMKWNVSKITNPDGNYIEFFYYKNAYEGYCNIAKICYGGNSHQGTLPFATIQFVYEKAVKRTLKYIGGSDYSTSLLISKILTDVNGAFYSGYSFGYGTDDGRTVLKEISRIGATGESVTNSIVIGWGTAGSQPGQNSIHTSGNINIGSTGKQDSDYIFGDFNGDGRSDYVVVPNRNMVKSVGEDQYMWAEDWNNHCNTGNCLNLHSGLYKILLRESDKWKMYYGNGDGTYTYHCEGNLWNKLVQLGSLGDYDADGDDDLLAITVDEVFNVTKRYAVYPVRFSPSTNTMERDNTRKMEYENVTLPNIVVGDFQGFGNGSFAISDNSYKTGAEEIYTMRIYSPFGSSLPTEGSKNIAFSDALGVKPTTTGDFNGDGKTDIFCYSYDKTRCVVFGLDFYQKPATEDENIIELFTDENFNVGDAKFYALDMNGDGLTDLVSLNVNNRTWKLHISTGKSFTTTALSFLNLVTQESEVINDVIVEDFNHDGVPDIAINHIDITVWDDPDNGLSQQSYTDKTEIDIVIGDRTQNKFITRQNIFEETTTRLTNNNVMSGSYYQVTFLKTADNNGDGIPELIFDKNSYQIGENNAGNKIYTSYSQQLCSYQYNTDIKKGLVHSITNGFDQVTEFDYGLATDNSFYTPMQFPDDPYKILKGPLIFGKSVTVKKNEQVCSKVSLNYEGGILCRTGKGFLGFKKISRWNEVTGMKEITFFNTSKLTYHLPLISSIQTWKVDQNGVQLVKLQEAINQNKIIRNTSLDIAQMFYYPERSNITKFIPNSVGGGGISIFRTEKTEMDNNGNLLKSEVITDDEIETAQYENHQPISPGKIPSIPKFRTLTRKKTGQQDFSLTVHYEYYPGTSRIKNQVSFYDKINNKATAKSLTSYFEYDNYGNRVLEKLSGRKGDTESSEIEERTATLTFDPCGRFPLKIVNPEGHVAMTIYDDRFGLPIESTDINGLKTYHKYDEFGRVVEKTDAAGNKTKNTYRWCNSSEPNAIYYITNETNGWPKVETYFDVFGREIKTGFENYTEQMVYSEKTFDNRGQLISHSTPYFAGSVPAFSISYTYDDFGRVNLANHGSYILQYGYSGLSTTIENTTGGIKSTSEVSKTGRLAKVTDAAGKNLEYTYTSNGAVDDIIVPRKTVDIEYDNSGQQTFLDDPDAGAIEYTYNAFGEIISMKDAKNNVTTYKFDKLGRVKEKEEFESATNGKSLYKYQYDKATNGIGTISSVEGPNNHKMSMSFDENSRVIEKQEVINGETFVYHFEYDNAGRIISTTYPSGLKIKNVYNQGVLEKITDNQGRELWSLNSMNSLGTVTSYKLGNGKQTDLTYTTYGYLEDVFTPGVNNWHYEWDSSKDQLLRRENKKHNQWEIFTYDNDKLWQVRDKNNVLVQEVTYDDAGSGRIVAKTDAGTKYVYDDDNPPHAVDVIENATENIPEDEQNVQFTAFSCAKSIVEGANTCEFTYGYHQQRIAAKYTSGGLTTEKYYLPDVEIVKVGQNEKILHYLGGPTGLFAIVVKEGNELKTYYTYCDYLGSINEITDDEGNVLEEMEMSFDAWGRRRNPRDWNSYTVTKPLEVTGRGYTGQEHLDQFGLINLNGRLYDPVVGQLLGADNNVTDPTSTIDYNRFLYARGNPLKYNDPTGQSPVKAFALTAGFACIFLGNVITGEPDAAGSAWKESKAFTKEMDYWSNNFQVPVHSTENTSVTAGLDIFNLGVSANYYHTSGNVTTSASAGLGFINGAYISGSVSYRAEFGKGNYVDLGIMAGTQAGQGSRYGGGIEAGGRDFAVGLSTMTYKDDKGSQRVGGAMMRIGDFTMRYENDGAPFQVFGNLLNNGTDKYRTNAVQLSIKDPDLGDVSLRMNLYTGDYETREGVYGKGSKRYPKGYYSGGNVDDFRLGGLTIGVRGSFVGVNSEWVRHIGQNIIAHQWFSPQPAFYMCDTSWEPYLPNFPLTSKYSLW